MAKIRSIKPESCLSETLADVSERAALLFAYLPCFCDDEGRMKYSPILIKTQIFGLRDTISKEDCATSITELCEAGLISVYSVAEKDYLEVTNFKEHQHPQKPKKSIFPAPPRDTVTVLDDTYTNIVSIQDDSNTDMGSSGSSKSNSSSNSNSNGIGIVEQAREIIEYLNAQTEKSYKPDSKKTLSLIKARIDEGATVDNFKRVIDVKSAEWLRDPKMNRYLRPETLFSLSHFEGYLNEELGVKSHEEYDQMRSL